MTDAEVIEHLLAACREYHDAIDTELARQAGAPRKEGEKQFMPTQSHMWPAVEQGFKAIQLAEAHVGRRR